MKDNQGSFDSLVAGLSLDERVSMLQQIKSQINAEIKYLGKNQKDDTIDVENLENLKRESLLVRIILTIKSLFSTKTKIVLYSEFQLAKIIKKTASNYPDYFNAQASCLERGFYDALEEFKSIANFFKPSIVQSNEEPGKFLILLGSLILTDLEKRIEEVANPYNKPFTLEVPSNLRISLLRKMEGILADVAPGEKEHLYACVKGLTWLQDFCDISFESFQQKFSKQANGKLRCPILDCRNEIEQLSNLLCNLKNIEPEILEALYLFSIQNKIDKGEDIDIQEEIDIHMTTSLSSLENLVLIINTIPYRTFYKISKSSLSAEPTYNSQTEDWYVLYKEQWKKRFDGTWANWQHDRTLTITKNRISTLCHVKHYPVIPNRPWAVLNLSFQRDYTIGFLYCFIQECYITEYKEIIKTLIMDGEFIIPENKIELMDAFAEINALAKKINLFNEKLSPEGVYGSAFLKFQQENLYTIQGRTHLKNLLLTLVAEVDVLVLSFSNIIKSFEAVLGGILITNYNAYYDGISNLALLTLQNKKPIRNYLIDIKNGFSDTEIILKDLASIELREVKNV